MAIEREFSMYLESCVSVLPVPYKKFFEILDGFLNISFCLTPTPKNLDHARTFGYLMSPVYSTFSFLFTIF